MAAPALPLPLLPPPPPPPLPAPLVAATVPGGTSPLRVPRGDGALGDRDREYRGDGARVASSLVAAAAAAPDPAADPTRAPAPTGVDPAATAAAAAAAAAAPPAPPPAAAWLPPTEGALGTPCAMLVRGLRDGPEDMPTDVDARAGRDAAAVPGPYAPGAPPGGPVSSARRACCASTSTSNRGTPSLVSRSATATTASPTPAAGHTATALGRAEWGGGGVHAREQTHKQERGVRECTNMGGVPGARGGGGGCVHALLGARSPRT